MGELPSGPQAEGGLSHHFYISTPYPKTQMRAELEEMGLVTRNDFNKYDGMHANLRTRHLSDEEVQYITWEMNARYYDLDWIRYNKVKKIYLKWFAGEIKRLVPFYAKRKLDLATGRKTPRDFFQEDLESGSCAKEWSRISASGYFEPDFPPLRSLFSLFSILIECHQIIKDLSA